MEKKQSIVPISEKYRVVVDKFNHILEEFVPSKLIDTGNRKGEMSESKWSNMGYYPNMYQCLQAVFDSELTGPEYASMDDYMKQYSEISQRILNHAMCKS